MLLEAEFLGIVLVLVYVGAVMVLFLFVVMMLDVDIGHELRGGSRATRRSACWSSRLVMAMLGVVVWSGPNELSLLEAPPRAPADFQQHRGELGAVLYTEYVYAFEIAAVLLLVAIIAAITLTMRTRPGRSRCRTFPGR
jgi:NADH-quinone oxidoreductase subunit J